MPDRWESEVIICKGGIDQSQEALTQGTINTGTAFYLQNYEPSEQGGYKRILGYQKWDDNQVPGSGAVLGVGVGFDGVFATRLNGANNAIYFSTGSGWGSALNSTPRVGSVVKSRFISYSITKPVIIQTDGFNPAWKWDGASETLINGTGAPADPKFAAMHLARLVLAGYSSNPSAISLSVPNNDTDFHNTGAIEINVGDVVTGLRSFREILYIFCKRSIFRLTGTDSSTFVIESVTRNIGCVSNDSIQEVGGDLIYLSGEGFRSLAGTQKVDDLNLSLMSRQVTPLLRGVLGNFTENDYSALTIRDKSQYRVFLNTAAATDAVAVGLLGKYTENGYEWCLMRGINVYCCSSSYNDELQEYAVFGHRSDGYVYQLEQGNSFDGTSITSIYITPKLTLKDATLRKVLQKISILMQVEGNVQLSLTPQLDYGNEGTMQPTAIPVVVTTTLATYGTSLYGAAVYSVPTVIRVNKNLIGSAYTVSLQFVGSSNSLPPHRIDSIVLDYALKGRR